MKKFFFLAVAVVAMASCAKDGGPAQPEAPQGPINYEAPAEAGAEMPVLFGSNVSIVKSKSQGAIDVWNAKQTLYVYGFNRNIKAYNSTTPGDVLINNVSALSPASGMKGAIEVYNPAVSTDSYKEKFFYSGTTCYDFYGYYVDDAAGENPAPVCTEESVTLPIAINGGQDIMLAKADQRLDVQNATTTVNPDHAYSAYSARRGVQPNLIFQHQLTQFTFYIVDGDYAAEIAENPDYVSPVRVESISLTSRVNGVLTIAGAQTGIIPSNETPIGLLLQKLDENGKLVKLEDGKDYDPTDTEMINDDIIPTKDAQKVGACLMVYPEEPQHTLSISKRQVGKTSSSEPSTLTITPDKVDTDPNAAGIQPATTFEAGKSYKITILVYREREVEITAELTPWVEAGDIIFDEDDPSTWEN